MSTTSCPRCSGQVTLPLGVSNSTVVRCPLCHAHYTLADALVNMPPLLEVVDEAELTAEWRDSAPEEVADAEDAVREGSLDDLDLDEAPTADTVAGPDLAAAAQAEELSFEAAEAEDEDHDTEVEDLTFSTFDSIPPTPAGVAGIKSAEADDDNALDFGEPLAAEPAQESDAGDDEMALDFSGAEASEDASEAETIEFGAVPRNDPAHEDEIAFDLDQPATVGADDATIEFSDAPSIRADDDVEFNLETPEEQGELGEFGDVQVEASGEAEEISFESPVEVAPVAVAADEIAAGKKGKKKKEKKAKAPREPGKRPSLVGMLAVPILVLPFALYGAMWAGFDPIGLAGYLPRMMVPAGLQKKQVAQGNYAPPAIDFKNLNNLNPGDINLPENQGEAEPTDASGEHTAARPTTEGETPAETPPADTPPALDSDMPPAEPAAEAPAAEPVPPDAVPAEPSTAPADAATAPAEMPDKPAEPAGDDPFGAPTTPAEATPSEPTPELPAADAKPAEPAADADPFGAPEAAKPAADDPFAPAPSEKPDASDPFAPAPAEKVDAEPLPEPSEPAQPIEVVGPRHPQNVTPAELQQAGQATMTAFQQLVAAEGAGDQAQLPKARANFYVNLFGMANALTSVQQSPAAAALDPQLQTMEGVFRQQLASDPKRLEHLKVFGARWFSFPKRTNNGVVLAGKVESVESVGPLFHAKIRPGAADSPAVTIVSAKDPQLAAGDEVLALGTIVDKPQDELAGYQGSEPSVVWSGMTLKLAPAGN
jgi:hypothetical protein